MRSISDFLIGQKIIPAGGLWRLLDTRPKAIFRRLHLVGAVSLPVVGLNFGVNDLEDSLPSILLPARHEPLLLIVESEARGESIASFLRGRGRDNVQFTVQSEESLGTMPAEVLATGDSVGHLWSPPPYLVEHFSLLPPAAAGPVLDLGCGSGRAMVWLAERGYQVTGIDHQPEALVFGKKLADLHGVTCRFVLGDLRKPDCVPEGKWSIVLNFRFLQRELLGKMATELLKPGGVGIIRTFRDAPGYNGHPAPVHRLGRAELLTYFPGGLCEILAHEETYDADGRPAAGVVVRRII